MSGTTNGNGGSSIKEDLAATKVDKVTEISILALFFVQHIGKASLQDVDDQIRKIHGEINEHLLNQAMEGLRGRGLLSYARGKNKQGDNIQMYRVTKVKWASPPEIAHINNLLPALVATQEARDIISILNNAEESGKDGVKKAKTRLGYTDYCEVRITFRTKNPIVGSQVSSPYLEEALKKSPFKYPIAEKGQSILRFWRDETTGAVILTSDAISGWLRTGLRQGLGLSESVVNYVGVTEVHLFPEIVNQVSLPVIDQNTRKGLGINTYEIISKGTEFDIYFRLPKKGLADPLKFVAWMTQYAPRPLRGLSPARGKRFGRMEVIDYEILTDSSNVEKSLAFVEKDLEDPRAKKVFADMLAKAKQYNMSFTKAGDFSEPDEDLDEAAD